MNFYRRPEYTYAALGVVPTRDPTEELRVAAKRTTVRDVVALTKVKRADGRWHRRPGIVLPADSIPHLIHLLTRALESLPTMPLPPGTAPRPLPAWDVQVLRPQTTAPPRRDGGA